MNRIWKIIGSTELVGIALMLAGAVVALAPTAVSLENPSIAWFVTAMHDAGTTRTAVSILLGCATLLAGFAFIRVTSGRRRRTRNLVAILGAGVMGAGVLIGTFSWFSGHLFIPVSRASIAVGQTVDSVPTVQLGRTMKLMLPLRAQLLSLDTDAGTAKLRFSRAGESEGVEETVNAAEPVVFGDYRIALVGFDFDQRHLSASLEKVGEGTIPASGTVGSEVQFELNGPKYSIKRIARNYVGVMGAAVELTDEDDKSFWAFQRSPDSGLDMSRNITVTQLSTAPLAVFAISSSGSKPDLGLLAIMVFLIGMALFIGFPDPGAESLNESGPAGEEEN